MPKQMKVTGGSVEIQPPEGKEFPPCTRCFLPPTVVVIHEADTASMMKAKILGMDMPKRTIVLKPCEHSFPYTTNKEASVILGLEWGEEQEQAKAPKQRRRKKRK